METKGILLRARSLFQSLRIPASGLTAQRQRLDVIAQNIANAETTRTADGGPYRRQVASLAEVRSAPTFRLTPPPWEGGAESVDPTRDLEGVQVVGVSQDPSDLVPVYDPGHPDANEDGYVLYPNVELTAEMVDLMGARRVYEANLSVFQAVKSMLRQATQI
ncbi:MAG: flagellar basal body rod protein FlgC [Longimicrobiales bacterium]